jgi:hypothetical protein
VTLGNQNFKYEEMKSRLNSGMPATVQSVFLPCVLYGHETWSHTIREEHTLRVLEDRVLRKIFGGKREEMTEAWRKLLMRSFMIFTRPKIFEVVRSRRMRWVWLVAHMGEKKGG